MSSDSAFFLSLLPLLLPCDGDVLLLFICGAAELIFCVGGTTGTLLFNRSVGYKEHLLNDFQMLSSKRLLDTNHTEKFT